MRIFVRGREPWEEASRSLAERLPWVSLSEVAKLPPCDLPRCYSAVQHAAPLPKSTILRLEACRNHEGVLRFLPGVFGEFPYFSHLFLKNPSIDCFSFPVGQVSHIVLMIRAVLPVRVTGVKTLGKT
jgi:hypothetical protein